MSINEFKPYKFYPTNPCLETIGFWWMFLRGLPAARPNFPRAFVWIGRSEGNGGPRGLGKHTDNPLEAT